MQKRTCKKCGYYFERPMAVCPKCECTEKKIGFKEFMKEIFNPRILRVEVKND